MGKAEEMTWGKIEIVWFCARARDGRGYGPNRDYFMHAWAAFRVREWALPWTLRSPVLFCIFTDCIEIHGFCFYNRGASIKKACLFNGSENVDIRGGPSKVCSTLELLFFCCFLFVIGGVQCCGFFHHLPTIMSYCQIEETGLGCERVASRGRETGIDIDIRCVCLWKSLALLCKLFL